MPVRCKGMETNKKIQAICENHAQNHRFSGVCLVKRGNEALFSGAYGYANRAFCIPNQLDTRFDAASVTKIFTAAAVLALVENGQLRLDDNIADVIDLRGTRIPGDVTIHHLLSHTSGIADDADEESGESYADLFIDHPNYAIRKCADFLPNFAYKKPNFKAGTAYRYNNCAFILLGLAMEKATGMDCRDYMAERIFEPCAMADTAFCAMDDINANTAEGYVARCGGDGAFLGWKKNIYSYPPMGTPDGGVYTTAEDLHAFTRALCAGKVLGRPYTDMLLRPQCAFVRAARWNAAPGTRVRYGYAFEFIEIDGEIFCMYKDGQNSGVAAAHAYYPAGGVTVSILANQDCNVWQMHREIQTELYNALYPGGRAVCRQAAISPL